MNRYLLPPARRILWPSVRLPLVQHPGEAIAAQLTGSLADRDAIRRAGTTASNRTCIAPLRAVQAFTLEGVGFTNTPESMQSGLRARNAPRVADKTRGQSAGM